eukprot:3006414-Rhodomonas_salina.4
MLHPSFPPSDLPLFLPPLLACTTTPHPPCTPSCALLPAAPGSNYAELQRVPHPPSTLHYPLPTTSILHSPASTLQPLPLLLHSATGPLETALGLREGSAHLWLFGLGLCARRVACFVALGPRSVRLCGERE